MWGRKKRVYMNIGFSFSKEAPRRTVWESKETTMIIYDDHRPAFHGLCGHDSACGDLRK